MYPKSKKLKFRKCSETTYCINGKWEVDENVKQFLENLDGKTNPYYIDDELTKEEVKAILRVYRSCGWLVNEKRTKLWKKSIGIFAIIALFCLWNVVKEKNVEKISYNTCLMLENIEVEPLESADSEFIDSCSLDNSKIIIAQIVNPELTMREKERIGQQVVYVEARYLGLNSRVPLLKISDHQSSYDYKTNTIYISKEESLDDYKEFIQRILHLVYHAYQHNQVEVLQTVREENKEMVTLRLFSNAIIWEEELQRELYNGCDENKIDETLVEKAADFYSENSIADYIEVINEFWHTEKC